MTATTTTVVKKQQTYEKMDPITHMHRRPDMYVGSTSMIESHDTEWIARSVTTTTGDERIEFVAKEHLVYVPALLRIFIEAVSNAIDNVWRSRESGVPCRRLEISVDTEKNEFSVVNDGLVIPFMDTYKDTGIRIPELIFGHLMTSTNYDDGESRLTSGRNGLGINCTNIFSTHFDVEIFDSELGRVYQQKWTDHMRQCHPAKIKDKKGKDSYVRVRWSPDLSLFGLEAAKTTSSPVIPGEDMTAMFFKYAVDMAAITRIPVKWNGRKIAFRSFLEYVKLYPIVKETVVLSSTETLEVVLTNASPDHGHQHIVFTNGIYNRHGGVFVDNLLTEILRVIKTALAAKKIIVTTRELKDYFCIFVNARVHNPEFNNQSKDRVVKPSSVKTFHVEPKALTAIMKWSWREELREAISQKEMKTIKKTEKRKVRIEGYDPANLAGTKHSHKCALILCEGLSAKTFAVTGIETGWNNLKGRDYYGIMALRGKVLNVRNASLTSISANREVTNILQALNLKYNTDYSKDENFRQLEYGKVLILTDSDNDGTHIASLILNYFDVLFPSLLQRDFVYIMKTPIAKANQKVFYNEYEYHEFLETLRDNNKKYSIKYYKGLGTSNTQEIRDTFGRKVLRFVSDKDCGPVLNMAFHGKLANERKAWIENFDPKKFTEFHDEYPISTFIHQELIRFSIDDCRRNIPNLFDGLKTSQRKILYSVFKRRLAQSMKVAQLAGYVAEVSNYHHGEQCLLETIVRMAQSYPGSNNLPLLFPDGQFGSRLENGKDSASGRYIFTRMQPYTRILFPEADDPLLRYVYDDNDKVEPEFYLPVLPMIMINGVSTAIGTGFSCTIPPYNILDVSRAVLSWIEHHEHGKEWRDEWVDAWTPYYEGYKGIIHKIDVHKFRSTGILREVDAAKRKYRIDELAIGVSTNKYKEFLEELVESKRIRQYQNYSSATDVHFEIVAMPGFDPTEESMKLHSTIHLSNMVVFGEQSKLQKYETLSAMFRVYCRTRYHAYEQQKQARLKSLEDDLMIHQQKRRFLDLILSKTLDLSKYTDGDLETVLREKHRLRPMNGSFQYLLSTPIHHLTKTRLQALMDKIKEIEKEIERLRHTSPGDLWVVDIQNLHSVVGKTMS